MFTPIELKDCAYVGDVPYVYAGPKVLPSFISKKQGLAWLWLTRNQALGRMRNYAHYPLQAIQRNQNTVSWTYIAQPGKNLTHPVFIYELSEEEKLVSLIVEGMTSWTHPFSLLLRPRRMKAVYEACFPACPFY